METGKVKAYLEKYWEGESSLEEEAQLRTYFLSEDVDPSLIDYKPLFVFFQESSVTSLDKEPSSYIERETKVFSIGKLRAIAATLLILAAAVIGFNYLNHSDTANGQKIMAIEIDDPEEAYEITKDALAFLSVKYKKGSDPLSVIPKSIQSTRIFK